MAAILWSELLGNSFLLSDITAGPVHNHESGVVNELCLKNLQFPVWCIVSQLLWPHPVNGSQVLQNYLTTEHQWRRTVFIPEMFQNLLHWSNDSGFNRLQVKLTPSVYGHMQTVEGPQGGPAGRPRRFDWAQWSTKLGMDLIGCSTVHQWHFRNVLFVHLASVKWFFNQYIRLT